MKKGEIWVSNFWEGRQAVLIGNRVEPNLWDCKYLVKIKDKEYAYDEGGRVTGNPYDTSYYTGEGRVIEDVFSKFYHPEGGIEIVPMPESSPVDTVSSGDSTTWLIYHENNS
jgi:hypothetical protein